MAQTMGAAMGKSKWAAVGWVVAALIGIALVTVAWDVVRFVIELCSVHSPVC